MIALLCHQVQCSSVPVEYSIQRILLFVFPHNFITYTLLGDIDRCFKETIVRLIIEVTVYFVL